MPRLEELQKLVAAAEQMLSQAYLKQGGFKIDEARNILRDARLSLLECRMDEVEKNLTE